MVFVPDGHGTVTQWMDPPTAAYCVLAGTETAAEKVYFQKLLGWSPLVGLQQNKRAAE